MIKQKLIDVIIKYIFYFLITTPIHEWFHYQVGTALGGTDYYITYWQLFNGYCHFAGGVPHYAWLAFMAGGVGTGVLMLLLAWRAWMSPTSWDEADLFILSVLGGAQIGWGLAETTLAYPETRHLFTYLMPICVFIGVLPAVIWRFKPFLMWLTNDNKGG